MLVGLGEDFSLKTFPENVGNLDSTNINALNFGYYDVKVKEEIQNAQKSAATLFKKLNL